MFQQVDWQEDIFDGTVLGVPTGGLTITATIAGQPSAYQPYEKAGDSVGKYRLRLAPYEIKSGASVTVTYASATANFDTAPSVIALTDPATLSTGTQYCTVYDLYLRFGSENINQWADLNNARNIDEITETIINQIVYSSDYVDTKIRNKKYTVPFTAPFPEQIIEITRLHAGTQLHTNRGIDDLDGTFAGLRNRADWLIRDILAGRLELVLSTITDDPQDE